MNKQNEREGRVEEVTNVDLEVGKTSKTEVRRALKREKSGKTLGPDDTSVEVWKLREVAVELFDWDVLQDLRV